MIGYHGWTVKMGFYASVDPNLGGLLYQLKQASKQANEQTSKPTHLPTSKGKGDIFQPTAVPVCLPIHTDPTQPVCHSPSNAPSWETQIYIYPVIPWVAFTIVNTFLRTRLSDKGMKSRENKITGHFGQASKSSNRLNSREFCDLIVFHSLVCIRIIGALIKTQMAEPHPLGFSFSGSGGECAEKVLLSQVPRWGWCFWYLGPHCESHSSTPWGKAWICF